MATDYRKFIEGDGRITAKVGDAGEIAFPAKVYGKFPDERGDRKPTGFVLTLNGRKLEGSNVAITLGSKEYGGYTYFRYDGKIYFVAGILPTGVVGKFEPGTRVAGTASAGDGRSFADLYAPVVPLGQTVPKSEAPKASAPKTEAPKAPARKRSRR